MSSGTLRGAGTSVDLVAGISLVSILQKDDWIRVSTPVKHSLKHLSLQHIFTRVQCNVLSWALVSS